MTGERRIEHFDTAESPKTANHIRSKYAGMIFKNGLADRFSVDIETVEDHGIIEHHINLVDKCPDLPIPEFLLEEGFVLRRSREHKKHVPDDSFYEGDPHSDPPAPKKTARVLKNAVYRYSGEEHTIADWARLMDMPYQTLRQRLINGWAIGEALTTPVRGRSH